MNSPSPDRWKVSSAVMQVRPLTAVIATLSSWETW